MWNLTKFSAGLSRHKSHQLATARGGLGGFRGCVPSLSVWKQQRCDGDGFFENNTFLPVPSVTSVICRVIWDDALSGELLFCIYHGPNAIIHTELLERRGGGGDGPVDEYMAGDECEQSGRTKSTSGNRFQDSSLSTPGLRGDLYGVHKRAVAMLKWLQFITSNTISLQLCHSHFHFHFHPENTQVRQKTKRLGQR